jgi:hypothetical protein
MTDSKFGLSDDLFSSDFSWESNAAAISAPSRESALVYQLDRYRAKPEQRGVVSHWQATVLSKLLQLADLPPNWDGYDAKSLRHDTALFAMLILENIMQADTPIPTLVPTSTGGLQLEWHEHDIDLEINVKEPNRCEYWFEDLRSQSSGVSAPLETNFFPLETPIRLLTSRAQQAQPIRRRA